MVLEILETTSAVGGNKFYNLSFQIKSINGLPDDTGLEWLLFTDVGSIWETDYKVGVQGFDDMGPRVTNGFGLINVNSSWSIANVMGFSYCQ